MARTTETTYAFRIKSLQQQLRMLDEQIETEKTFLQESKQGHSLVASLLSASIRSNTLFQVSQAKARLAQLKSQRTQADFEVIELHRLQAAYPDHDQLIEKRQQVSFRTLSIELQEDELDLYDREMMVEMKLDDLRERQEAAALAKELKEVEQQQRELDAQQRELERKKAKLARRRAHHSK